MESNRFRRHISRDQKKLLVKLIKANPRELLTGTVTRDFSHQDFQRIWRDIAVQCNALPGGAEKTWKQWRKCWQDLRHRHQQDRKKTPKVKKTIKVLSAEEKDRLLSKISNATDDPDGIETEFAEFHGDQDDETVGSDFMFEVAGTGSYSSDQDMLPETKVFDQPLINSKVKKSDKKRESRHSCEFNCETLAAQEERKVQIKEDYYNFKKDYLMQKLKCMKEQSEALQVIARHLGEKSIDALRFNGENV